MATKQEIEREQYTGYVRGEFFSGEWPDGTTMEGYPMFSVFRGVFAPYGEFSPTGKVEDCEDAGDLFFVEERQNAEAEYESVYQKNRR